jgi:hypothetical protein
VPESLNNRMPKLLDNHVPKLVDNCMPELLDNCVLKQLDNCMPKPLDNHVPKLLDNHVSKLLDNLMPQPLYCLGVVLKSLWGRNSLVKAPNGASNSSILIHFQVDVNRLFGFSNWTRIKGDMLLLRIAISSNVPRQCFLLSLNPNSYLQVR